MSDIEDGELLSSDNEDINQLPSKEDKKHKSKYKDKNHLDTNNNLHDNVIENWNFHKNEENYKRNKKKNSKSPQESNKRTQHHKSDSIAIKRVRKSINSDNKEKEYYSQNKNEIVNDFKVEPQDSVKRKILCKYYAGGECKNGANCLFMHEDFPCKFFHDKALVCRAGDGCKYSHAPLTEDMKLVMDCFIQEGKEYKTTTTAPSAVPTYNTMTPVHNRIKCLLPTPTIINPILPINQNLNENMSILSGQEFNNDMSINYNQNHVSNFKTRFIDPSLRTAHPPLLQRPRLPINDFHHRFPMNNFSRAQPELYNNDNSFIPVTNSTGQMYSDISRNEKYNQDAFCVKPEFIPHPEININQPPPSCDIRSNQQINAPQTNSYNNHAPARFIVGLNNQSNFSKPPETTNNYYNFKEELKKLADQIISQPCEEMPLSPEISNNTIDSEKSPRNDDVQEEQISVDNPSKPDEALSPKELKENTEIPSVRIAQNTSIFNINENELSESDKQYFNEMRNMINLEAQFESKTPWVAIKLERIEKQPYILFNLKIEEVHESATLDPRLTGHPVLRLIENQNEDPDEETVDQYPKNHSRVGVGDSDDDDSSQGQLNIDLSQPQCDTRSYLYDCKFKRKKVSEQIML